MLLHGYGELLKSMRSGNKGQEEGRSEMHLPHRVSYLLNERLTSKEERTNGISQNRPHDITSYQRCRAIQATLGSRRARPLVRVILKDNRSIDKELTKTH